MHRIDPTARVAFQGEPGAFSEIAARKLLGERIRTIACPSFESLFSSIDEGRADLILAPLENTLAGPVLRCYDLLYQSASSENPLEMTGEVVLRISHCVIACCSEGASCPFSMVTTSRSSGGAAPSCRCGARASARAFSSSSDNPMILPGRTPTSIRRRMERSLAVSASEYLRSPFSSRDGFGNPYRRSHIRRTSFDNPVSRSTALML